MIPFNKSSLTGKDEEYTHGALAIGKLSGDGLFTKKCHAILDEEKKDGLQSINTHIDFQKEVVQKLDFFAKSGTQFAVAVPDLKVP